MSTFDVVGDDPHLRMGNFAESFNQTLHLVRIPPPRTLFQGFKDGVNRLCSLKSPIKDNPDFCKSILAILRYVFPVFEWGKGYDLRTFRDDFIAGLTIASLSIPQGIGYSQLAGLPPIYGLYTTFVPPLIYAIFGSSRHIGIGPAAVVSILFHSLLNKALPLPASAGAECNSSTETDLTTDSCVAFQETYLSLALTATFFAGLLQFSLGFLRFGFLIDFFSHASVVGFTAAAAIIIGLQQIKGLAGIPSADFTNKTDFLSVVSSAIKHTDKYHWQTIVIGLSFYLFLVTARSISKRKPRFFWVAAIGPLISIILSTLLVTITRVDRQGVSIVGDIGGKINHLSTEKLSFGGQLVKDATLIGFETGVIALVESTAIGRTFASLKGYKIDGNKEMIAVGIANIVGSCSSCFIAAGAFSRSAVNYNAGCKTPVANVVMALIILIVITVATPLFRNLPNCILASIIMDAVTNLIDIKKMIMLWKVDRMDFLACLGAFLGVLFVSIEVGLLVAVILSLAKVLLHEMRPGIAMMGMIPGLYVYRDMDHYPDTIKVPAGVLLYSINGAVYFLSCNYISDRIITKAGDEKERLSQGSGSRLQYLIIDMSNVTDIDTTGIHMFEDVLLVLGKDQIQLVIANPGARVIQKMKAAGFVDLMGQKWIFLTEDEAVRVCTSLLHVNQQ